MEENLIADISKYTKKLVVNDLFYGLFLSTIPKIEDKKIPLAAVSLNKSSMEFALHINPDEWFKQPPEIRFGVLEHEAKHLALFHLITADKYPNSRMDNIATDTEINQSIDKRHLPEWGIFIENLEKEFPQLDWKRNAGRHHYYKELSKLSEEDKKKIGISDKAQHIWIITDLNGNPVDSLSESEAEAITVQVQGTIEAIVEEIRKSQGNIPSEIDQLIKGFIKPKPKFNYQKYLRNYIGNSVKYTVGTSKLRENQRFPDQPKVVLKPLSKMLVLLDLSGSVSEKELHEFLNEIHHASKKMDIEIHPFDTQVMPEVKYNKNKKEFKRTQCGGTSFGAAVSYYNKRKEFQSCIIFTDGYAEIPPKCNKRLLWVISSNGTIESIKNHSTWVKIPSE